MKTNYIKKTFLLCAMSLLLNAALTGCFKSDIAVDVNAIGWGSVSVSAGMTEEAQMLVSDLGSDPLQGMEDTLTGRIGAALAGIEGKRWSEGDYDWVRVTKRFSSIEQINQIAAESTLFNRFSLTKKWGFLQNEFILDAELPALGLAIPAEYDMFDTSEYVEMNFSARLPGTLLESNGVADAADPNRLVWQVPFSKPVTVQARSLAWNWINIIGMAAVAALIPLFGGFLLVVYFIRRKKNK